MELFNEEEKQIYQQYQKHLSELQGNSQRNNEKYILYSDMYVGKFQEKEHQYQYEQKQSIDGDKQSQKRLINYEPTQQKQNTQTSPPREYNRLIVVPSFEQEYKNKIEPQKTFQKEKKRKSGKKSVEKMSTVKGTNQKQQVQEYQNKLLEQLERMVRLKSIDDNFLLKVMQKHLRECPQFGQTLKNELKSELIRLQQKKN